MENDELTKQWHAPFCAAMRLELRENKDILSFHNEYNLSSKPLQMDLLIIKKPRNVVIANEIGKLFRGHNIIEYKSPDYTMDENTYYKVLGYAYFYKSLDEHTETIDIEDITITLIREGYPRELMKYLEEHDYVITQKFNGIYYIEKSGQFPVQIVTSKVLTPEIHTWLTSLTRKMDIEQAERLLLNMNRIRDKAERLHADAVLNLAMNANPKIFDKVKEENPMCEALLRLMKPEMDAAVSKAVNEAVGEAISSNTLIIKSNGVEQIMKRFGVTLAEACDTLNISLEDYLKTKDKVIKSSEE